MMARTLDPHHREGAGTPLVLLHGMTGTWRVWKPVLPLLTGHHDVFAPTLPGHRGGPALPTDRPLSIAALADGVERSLDAAGIERAHLAGNSLGGWLSLELARRGRAESVTALSPAGGWRAPEDLQKTLDVIAAAVRAGSLLAPVLTPALRFSPLRFGHVRRLALASTMARGDQLPAGALRGMVEDMLECTVLELFAEGPVPQAPFDGDMSDVTCPVRIAWAKDDRTIPFERHGAPLLGLIPQAELVLLPGVGHVPMFDDPGLVARTILEVSTASPVDAPSRQASAA